MSDIGGAAVGVVCDHSSDEQIEKLFQRIDDENNGRLDLIVNNCYAAVPKLLGAERTDEINKFWTQDPTFWDLINNVGLRANYVASVYAARLMTKRGSGLIVNMSSAGGAGYIFNAAYGIGKCAMDSVGITF